MRPVRRTLAVAATTVVALASFAVSSSPAQAVPDPGEETDPPCEWAPGQQRTHSGCDGRRLFYGGIFESCEDYLVTPYQVTVRGPGGVPLAHVRLHYLRGARTASYPNGICRLTAASIEIVNHGSSCYLKLERTSDRQAYRVLGSDEGTQYTPVLYDADTSSYAWGSCEYNNRRYDAGTPSY